MHDTLVYIRENLYFIAGKMKPQTDIVLQDVEFEPKEPASDEYMEIAQCDLEHTYDN